MADGGSRGAVRTTWRAGALAVGLLLTSIAMALPAADYAQAAATLVVNTTGDGSEPVANQGDGVCDVDTVTAGDQCSLRGAIQEANALPNSGGPDRIHFNIPGNTAQVKTIRPQFELPIIGDNINNTNDQAVIIDAYTQPGSKRNTSPTGAINAVPKIQINGIDAGSDADGLIIGGNSNVAIRGFIINRFDASGIFLTSTDGSDNNRIEGNFIGTNSTGTVIDPDGVPNSGDELGNGTVGVQINGLNDGNVVGGTLPRHRNLISGNGLDGVFAGTSGLDTIRGNLIGTDKTGTLDLHNGGTGNNGEGVNLGGQNSIVADNIIAFNTSDGVMVRSNATGVGHNIGPNSIFSNDGLGIDIVDNTNSGLGPNGNGPNTNDGGSLDDADAGPNDLQNFPEITSATTSSGTGQTTIIAFLDTAPNTQYTIRFYSNPRDTGEGRTFIGEQQATTDANGFFSNDPFVATSTVPVGQSITATATDPDGNTSEFSGEPRSVRSAP